MASGRVKPGDVLAGKYRVEHVLGAGGMGVVVAARHIELGQRVALKFMLKEAAADPSHAQRFVREARAAVQLRSVHTARVLDVGKLEGGEPFMVMEYLDGKDLDDVLSLEGPLSPHVACDYILQAAEALAEAHGLGMIHRDVKLKNIFRTSTLDGQPLVKVLDFGLAKQTGIEGDVSLTSTSAVFGSPHYMSPEQMRSAKDVDTRSDVWSLGVCLYELLTGRVPFEASGVAEVCAMVLKDPVPPPSRFAPNLPSDLEAAVLRCLEKDPRARFQTVAELAVALEPYAAEAGSARRIRHVMEMAQKTEVEAIMADTPPSEDDRSRTTAALSMGASTTGGRRVPLFVVVTLGMSAVLLVSGLTLISFHNAALKAAAADATVPLVSASGEQTEPAPSAPTPTSTPGPALGPVVPVPVATSTTVAGELAPKPGAEVPPLPPPSPAKAKTTTAKPAATQPAPTKPTVVNPVTRPTSTSPGDRF